MAGDVFTGVHGSDFTLINAREIEAKLLGLGAKVGKAIVRKCLRPAAHVMKQAVEANATSMVGGEMGGLIAESIGVRAANVTQRGKKRYGQYAVSVASLATFNDKLVYKSKDGHRSYIPAAIEYGHVGPGRGFRGKGGKEKRAAWYATSGGGKVAKPITFTRRAYLTDGPKAVQVGVAALKVAVEQAAREKA